MKIRMIITFVAYSRITEINCNCDKDGNVYEKILLRRDRFVGRHLLEILYRNEIYPIILDNLSNSKLPEFSLKTL